jgi:hypothetical protein
MRVLLPVAQALQTLPRATNSVVGGINAGAERRQASDVYTRFGGRRIPGQLSSSGDVCRDMAA